MMLVSPICLYSLDREKCFTCKVVGITWKLKKSRIPSARQAYKETETFTPAMDKCDDGN
jgi:hypothetical protein